MCSCPGPPEQGPPRLRIEFLPGGFQHRARLQSMLSLQPFGGAAIDVPSPSAHLPPRPQQLEAALLKRPRRVGHEPLGIEAVNLPQAAALGAHPLRAVEAEELRAGRLEADVAVRAGVVRGKAEVARRGLSRASSAGLATSDFLPPKIGLSPSPLLVSFCPLSRLASLFSAFLLLPPRRSTRRFPAARPTRRPRPGAAAAFAPTARRSITTSMSCRICRSSRRSSRQPHDAAVDAGADEPLLQQVLEEVAILALLPANQRREDQHPRAEGIAAIRSMICSRLCAVIGRPHCGQ